MSPEVEKQVDAVADEAAARRAKLKQLRRENVEVRDAIAADLAFRLQRDATPERDETAQKSVMRYRRQENALHPSEHQEKSKSTESDDDDVLVTKRDLMMLLEEIAAVTGKADGENDKKIQVLTDQVAALRAEIDIAKRMNQFASELQDLRSQNEALRKASNVIDMQRDRNVA